MRIYLQPLLEHVLHKSIEYYNYPEEFGYNNDKLMNMKIGVFSLLYIVI